MHKIMSLITDTLMHSGNNLTGFLASLWRRFFNFIPLALCFGKCLFLFPKKARISDLCLVRKHGELFNAHVNAYSRAIIPFFSHATNIARDRREPLTSSRACDCARFGRSFKMSVLHNTNTAYLTQSQALLVQPASFGKLRIGDRIIAILTLVSGKASFLARLCPLFKTAKERFECPIYTLAYLLENLRVYARKRYTLLLQHWQCRLLLIARQTFFILFPCLHSRTDKLVIQQATFFNVRQ